MLETELPRDLDCRDEKCVKLSVLVAAVLDEGAQN